MENVSIENILDYNDSLHLFSTSYDKNFTCISFIPHSCPELGTIMYYFPFTYKVTEAQRG